MKNEFGYIYNKPFKECNDNEQKQIIMNLNDNKIEIKVNDVEMFNTFDYWGGGIGKLIETKIFYGINSIFEPLTFLNASITNSNYRAIPHSTIASDMYIIGKQATNPIKHFEETTKVRSINYYNEDLINIFGSSSVIIKRKTSEINVNAIKEKDRFMCKIKCNHYSMSVYLVNNYKYSGNAYGIKIEPFTYLNIKFSKSIDLEEVLQINSRIDSVIHLFILSQKRNKILDLFGTKNNKYTFYNLKYNNEDKKKSTFYLGKNENSNSNFTKLLELFMNVSNDNINSFFPFLDYDRSTRSQEILFLEYYKVLEYMNILSQKKKGKEKDNRFLLPLLKKYANVKNEYFQNDAEEVIEEEIRSLRNYYSHYGYYIKQLPVPTDMKKTKYYKDINAQWLFNVKSLIKTISYLELYSLAGVDISEKDSMFHLR